MKKYYVLLILFVVISIILKITSELNFPLNYILFKEINSNQINFLNSFFIFFAVYGREYIWIPLMLILFVFKRTRKISVDLAGAFIIAIILGELSKFIMAQLRPFDYFQVNLLINEQNDFSYPSGHALIVSTGAIMLFKNKQKILFYIMLIEAVIVSYARVYVGVHWPIDIISGWLLGSWISYFYLDNVSRIPFINKIYSFLKAF
jgi:membrane-associated phospholipid phosphatase